MFATAIVLPRISDTGSLATPIVVGYPAARYRCGDGPPESACRQKAFDFKEIVVAPFDRQIDAEENRCQQGMST